MTVQEFLPVITGLAVAVAVLLPARSVLAFFHKVRYAGGKQSLTTASRERHAVCGRCSGALDSPSCAPNGCGTYMRLCTACAHDHIGLRKYFSREGFFSA